ncbi:MAG TPA: hypothetical protein VFA11_06765 [Acidimicrobiales bacterium]|nr:hypothetical protein [Acidimicrobiales bacterium]
MGDKSPKDPQKKKPGQTIKEKRAAKKAKLRESATGSIVPNRPGRG